MQVSIRNHQYDAVRNDIEQTLFGQSPVDLMSDKLGYTYTDLVTIREALPGLVAQRLEERVERITEFVTRYPNPEHSQATPAESGPASTPTGRRCCPGQVSSPHSVPRTSRLTPG